MSISIITLQRNAIKSLIPAMTITNGYNFDWVTVNQRNLALGFFPRAEVYNTIETNMDVLTGIGSMDYTNAGDWEIRLEGKLITSSDNPLFDIMDIEDKMIDDVKMLMGKNPSVSNTMDSFLYKGFTREVKAVDQFTPRMIVTKWRSVYSQDRITVTNFAGS